MTESKLQEALDLLDHGNRWTTGSYFDDGRMCMVGALRAVHPIPSVGAYCRDMERLVGAIPTVWHRQSVLGIVTSFNDASAWEDVALAFKKAIHDDVRSAAPCW